MKAVRIADRDHELADTDRLRITQRDGNQIRCRDTHHRQIRVRIVADSIRLVSLAIRQNDLYRARGMNNMTVGQNKTVWSKNEPRTRTTAPPLLLDFNLDDGRTYTLRSGYDSFGIGIEQR